ncbi:putative TolA protein [Enhygromyxa salina]|uniref:Putative TolA protein n=1 Tax=Enhygromyxa salina TaxID=215803 RepID=A0A0C2DGD9_9BACT|nr:putative TolA protein [Enhygromyxa salina]
MPWTAALGLVIAAVLANGIGLYATGSALARALEPVPKPEKEEIVEFNLVDSSDDRVSNDRQPEQLANENSQVEPEAEPAVDPEPQREPLAGRGKPELGERAQVRGDDTGERSGEQTGAGDDSLVAASDGTLDTQGADAGSQHGPKQLAGLGGSASMLNDTFGRPPSSDARQRDVDRKKSSMLDNERHLYSSFFSRMADRVREHWRPQKAIDSADPSGNKYGRSSRTTGLMVRLDAQGNILKLWVVQKSGVPELDDEAIRAMRAAGPFPNMPAGLVDSNGHVEFPFGFNLLDSGAWNIFRLSQQ